MQVLQVLAGWFHACDFNQVLGPTVYPSCNKVGVECVDGCGICGWMGVECVWVDGCGMCVGVWVWTVCVGVELVGHTAGCHTLGLPPMGPPPASFLLHINTPYNLPHRY